MYIISFLTVRPLPPPPQTLEALCEIRQASLSCMHCLWYRRTVLDKRSVLRCNTSRIRQLYYLVTNTYISHKKKKTDYRNQCRCPQYKLHKFLL